MRFFKYFVSILLLLGIINVTYSVLKNSGNLDTINTQPIDSCKPVTVSAGTEDVTVDKETGIVFVSADDRRNGNSAGAAQNGIYAFNADDPSTLKLVSIDGPSDLHPHGISLWSGDDEKRLFVINHRTNGDQSIEIYSVAVKGTLSHIKSVMFEDMSAPNDVHAVGPEAFYITNDKGYKTGIMSILEAYLGLPFSSVAYYNGNEGRTVLSGLTYSNGINQSVDGKHIYVSEVLPRTIKVFARNEDDGALELLQVIDTNSSPDNIEVDDKGFLWVGGHPNLLDFLAHSKEQSTPSPSHVMKIDPITGGIEDVFYDGGESISASSVGTMYKGKLIIGAVYDEHVLICNLR